ncbi:MAG: HAMP domain-containing histidine kinase [Lachnospiraceae bacterium]|nr:HAMP domain-containing histidine kinase [Lachnospiraceae bacterium]
MKRYRKRNYGYFFQKHFVIALMVWFVVLYAFLQICFLVIFEKEKQKTAVNFYEGMEKIQYLVKDHSLQEVEAEVTLALEEMSQAGGGNSHIFMDGGVGYVLGVKLNDFERHFVELSGLGEDGEGNVYIAGNGMGCGFIQDCDGGKIVYETGHENERYILHLIDRIKYANSEYGKSVINQYEYVDQFYCDRTILDPYLETLAQIKEKWWEYCRSEDPNASKRHMRWQLEEFYLKGDHFYPAKASLYYFDTAPGYVILPDNADATLMETYASEPPSLIDYTLYQCDLKNESAVFPWLDSGPAVLESDRWQSDDAFRKTALSEIASARIQGRTSDIGGGSLSGNPLTYFLNGEMKFVRTAYFHDAEGEEYKISVYQNMSNLFQGNLYFVMCWTIWYGIVILLLAVITSYLHYLKNSHVFMTKEYRNMLMDSMAHDLKSPLMAIGGYAENLKEHVNDDKRDHYAEEIQKSVGYMNDVVMKNLELLKFDKEHKKLDRKNVNMRGLFEEAFDRYQGEMEKQKLKVTLEGELNMKGDEALLQKVAENLVTNCVRYTSEGGEIKVTFEKHGFTVQNTTDIEYKGSLKKLWEPFVRGEDSRTGRGTGMGLAIVANVMDRHSWKYQLKYDKEKKLFLCQVKIPMGIIL